MIILGHKYIDSEKLYYIKVADEIKKTPPNSIVLFEFSQNSINLIKYCNKNGISFAVSCDSIQEIFFANALNAKYIICPRDLVSKAQRYADDYLFDAKILVFVEDEDEIDWVANQAIDGIIFEEGIVYGSY